MKKYPFLLIGILLASPGFSQSYQKRLALVIGNSQYTHGGALPNPVNDARAMATSLQSLGFEVLKYENVSQAQMKQAINAFGLKLKGYEVGLFYYAGHGIQNKGMNYMIPVEADLQAEEQVEYDCVAADRVLAYMEAAQTKMNMIVMDACRNNPFERSWHRSANGNGLAMMNAPSGTLIAYATSPGKVASDGESSNGLYTSALLKHMKDPGLNIEQVFKRVRTEVTEKSSGAQVPWETTSLTGDDFYLTNKKSVAVVEKESTGGNQVQKDDSNVASRSLDGEEDPEKALEYYSSAAKKYDENLYEEAITGYSLAIKADPMYTQAYLWRAHSKYAAQKYEESILDYTKTLQLSPGDNEAYYYRGNAKYSLKKYNEAIADFTLTIKYEPKNAKAYYYRGMSYYSLEKYVAGLDDFGKAVTIAPDDAMNYYWRANCNFMLEEYALAIEDFNKSIELLPDYSSSHFYKAHSYYNLENYTDAITAYSKSIELDNAFGSAYFWRAHAYEKLNRVPEAKKDAKKALSLEPENESYKTYEGELSKK
jgi:uncharacterized caspase-like protein/Flp pilus assembly protein TadD